MKMMFMLMKMMFGLVYVAFCRSVTKFETIEHAH